jgi:hypothetical protein
MHPDPLERLDEFAPHDGYRFDAASAASRMKPDIVVPAAFAAAVI